MGTRRSSAVVLAAVLASAALAVPAWGVDTRVTRDGTPGSYVRYDGGTDATMLSCSTGRANGPCPDAVPQTAMTAVRNVVAIAPRCPNRSAAHINGGKTRYDCSNGALSIVVGAAPIPELANVTLPTSALLVTWIAMLIEPLSGTLAALTCTTLTAELTVERLPWWGAFFAAAREWRWTV